MSETIGCAIAVHKALGPGFLESIYKRAMHIELDARGISYESEKPRRIADQFPSAGLESGPAQDRIVFVTFAFFVVKEFPVTSATQMF
jgi:GxxExxY protein